MTVAGTYALAGTLMLDRGTLAAGTVTSTGGQVVLLSTSTISGASWHGTLNVALSNPNPYNYYYTSLDLSNDSFTGASGSGAGSIALGTDVQAVLDTNAVLSDVAVSLNGAALVQDSGSLQIGSLSTVTASGSCLLGYYGGTIQNTGTISAAGTGTSLSVTATSFSGQGTVSVSNGASLFLTGGSVADAGLLSVGAGSYLDVQSNNAIGLFQNTQFRVQGGTLSLNASLATAQLAALDLGRRHPGAERHPAEWGCHAGPGRWLQLRHRGACRRHHHRRHHRQPGRFLGRQQRSLRRPAFQDGTSALNGVTLRGAARHRYPCATRSQRLHPQPGQAAAVRAASPSAAAPR